MLPQIDNATKNNEAMINETHDSIVTPQIITIQTNLEPLATSQILKKSFSERCRTHRFWLVRAIYQVVRSVWMVVMVVGGVIVWLIAMLFI